jgi:peptidoglycan hydrolase-like protein with peptidoglycan-binding domain
MPPAVRLAYSGDLHYRSSGPGIARLQARLRQLHYYNYPDLTGYFGDATFGAVWTFQQERHIPASGIADKRTIDALNACDASCTY